MVNLLLILFSFINNAHIMHKVFATYNAQEIRVFEINLKISNF